MMFRTIQTIYFLWGYDPGNMAVSLKLNSSFLQFRYRGMRKNFLSKIVPFFLLLMRLILLLQKRSLCSSALVSFVKDASRKMDISVTHLKPRHYVETATGAILISDADRRRDGTEEELWLSWFSWFFFSSILILSIVASRLGLYMSSHLSSLSKPFDTVLYIVNKISTTLCKITHIV